MVVCDKVLLIKLYLKCMVFLHLFVSREDQRLDPVADVVKNKIIQVVEERNLKIRKRSSSRDHICLIEERDNFQYLLYEV